MTPNIMKEHAALRVIGRVRLKFFGKEILLSLLLHVFLVASVFAIGSQFAGVQVPLVVFLGADGGGSQAGGGGSTKQVEGKKRTEKHARQCRASSARPSRVTSANDGRADKQPVVESKQEQPTVTTPSERNVQGIGEPVRTAMVGKTGEAESAGSGGGSGGGSGTGNGRAEGSGSGSGSGIGDLTGQGEGFGEGNARNRYVHEHFSYIRDLILKHLGYPPMARKFGWMGSLTVSFVVRENGTTELIRVVKSSGYEVLDQNVVQTIKNVQPFPKPPVKAELIIPITYHLQ